MKCHVCHGHKIVVHEDEATKDLTVSHCPECAGQLSYEEFIGRYCSMKNSPNVFDIKDRRK